ncbi:MAG: hypothetical protein JXO72_10135 [Vicinamibacteria bacterium]|nr:hypothetical protein [Vicinamibacteria bacterium]
MRWRADSRSPCHGALLLISAIAGTFLPILGHDASRAAAPPSDEVFGEAVAILDPSAVAAQGRQDSILNVPRLGRYAILVESPQGTSLQLVDRMAGPGPIEGAAGEHDGRVDRILERGEYKIVSRSHEQGRGTAKLSVRPFLEQNASPLKLVELKPVTTTLDDFEQRSYWLDLKERRVVQIEIGGRHLSDARIWKEGTWIVDTNPEIEIVAPRVGRPLRILRLVSDLEPGLYLLTAYGGPPLPWAEDDGSHPLHIRWEIPRLGEAGRRRMVVSPFGYDRYIVPSQANYFRIELPEARPAVLRVGAFDAARPFHDDGETAEVLKQSVPPAAEIMARSQNGNDRIVTISSAAGQPYVLQHFNFQDHYTFQGGGAYWISSVHSGHAEDSVDATAIGVDWQTARTAKHIVPFLTDAIALDARHGWARRCNLVAPLTVFFHALETGSYEILSKGTDARFRFEPFFTSRPSRYKAPPFRESGSIWDLDAGYWMLVVQPKQKGILDVVVRPKGLLDYVLDTLGFEQKTKARPVRASVRFPEVTLDPGRSYTIYLNRQPETRAGLIVRRLPLDLRDSLFVSQSSQATTQVPFKIDESGKVVAEAEDGALLELSVDGGAWRTEAPVAPGIHTVAVRHARETTTPYCLRFEPSRLDAGAPLPPLPDAALANLPEFPFLAESVLRYLDLDRQSSATYLVRAERPAIYRLSSTGLLATSGNLRSRTNTSLSRASQDGVGRNFSVQEYLGAGLYQLTVTTQERSAGHLGLDLSRSDPRDGGFLTIGAPARVSLAEGEAVEHRIQITRPGRFRLRALALGRKLRCRFEDAGGWPILAPGVEADVTHDLAPGRYRFIVLPETTPVRVITRIDPMPRVFRFTGHGPHPLPLARRIDHVWREPTGDDARAPDAWRFTIPATIDAHVEITDGMQGELYSLSQDGSRALAASILGREGWRGTLAQGRYMIEIVAAQRDNLAPYQLAVWPEQLVAGLDRDVVAPAEIPISVGATGLVELSSFGMADVRARLEDSEGRLVALSDDRPDDWNFAINRVLTEGFYRLRIDSVGKASGSCVVSMRTPREDEQEALNPPLGKDFVLGRHVKVYPLRLATEAQLFWITARSQESVGISFERVENGATRQLGSTAGRAARLEISLPAMDQTAPAPTAAAGARYFLRLWSVNRRDTTVHVAAGALTPREAAEPDLAKGVQLDSPAQKAAPSCVAVKIDRPGLFELAGAVENLRYCDTALTACGAVSHRLIPAAGRRIFIIGDAERIVSARRLVIGEKRTVQIPVKNTRVLAVDLETEPRGAVIVKARARLGQPGVVIDEAHESPLPAGPTIAIDDRSALSASLATKRPVARLWAAEDADDAFDVRLSSRRFASCDARRAGLGRLEGAVDPGSCHAFDFPGGTKRVRLALDADLVAVLSHGDSIESVHWSEQEPLTETIETTASRLTFLSARAKPSRYSAELLPLAPQETAPVIESGSPYEARHARGGALRLNVAASAKDDIRMLRVRGARSSPVFLSVKGNVSRGSDIALGPESGLLRVPHGTEPLVVWIDRPGEESHDLWATARGAQEIDLSPPASLPLEGRALTARLKIKVPVMLHLRAASPVVTRIEREGGLTETEAHPEGAVIDVFLPAGVSRLGLRAFGSPSMHGEAEITTSPVTPIGEGLGPETLLGPGETRLYSFNVAHEGAVGVGVRASADVVEAVLMNASGRRLGEGAVQMATLKPGAYLLALKAPAESPPVTARPAVAGLTPPDTGPPVDVIRRYVQSEPASMEFSAQRVVENEPTETEFREMPEEYGDESGNDMSEDNALEDDTTGALDESSPGGEE